MLVDAPSTLGRLREEHPGALGQRRIAPGGGNDVGQFPYDPELLVTIQDAGRGQDLDADVVSVPVDIGQRARGQVVDEGRGVLSEQGQLGDLLPPHDGRGQVLGKSVLVGKGPLHRVHVDHGHGSLLSSGFGDATA